MKRITCTVGVATAKPLAADYLPQEIKRSLPDLTRQGCSVHQSLRRGRLTALTRCAGGPQWAFSPSYSAQKPLVSVLGG